MKGERPTLKSFGTQSRWADRMRFAACLSLLVFALSLAGTTFAQKLPPYSVPPPQYVITQEDPSDTVPPPSRVITKEERSKLEAEKDTKDRTKLALELMDARIKLAEAALDREDFDSVHRELGGFQFLMDDALDYLNRRNNDSGSIRNNFKRYEITIRTFTPRIELIRRELPLRYEPYVFKLLRYLRDARTKAIEPQFGEALTN